jgi:hypothetical protein
MISKINIILISGVLIFASCNSAEKKDVIDPKVESESENNFNSQEFDFVLPQPISLAKAFQASGLRYVKENTNLPENQKKYTTKVKQLLNLGVYSTDLAYCAINGKSQEARVYLQNIQELGNVVGLKPVFSDKSLAEKFEKNLDNMEAIEDLIYDIQEKSEEYMEDNDVRYLAVVQFSGSWAEGMYLGIKDLEAKSTNQNLAMTIVDQINLLKNIVKGIKTYPTSDETLQTVISKMEGILSSYNGFATVKKANESSTFITPKLSEQEFATLATQIKELREFIIK